MQCNWEAACSKRRVSVQSALPNEEAVQVKKPAHFGTTNEDIKNNLDLFTLKLQL